MIRLTICLLLCMFVTVFATPAPARAADWNGRHFNLHQGVSFYIANPDGKPFEITAELRDINVYCQGAQTALLKVYAPDGEVIFREDLADDGVTSGGYQQAWAGWDHELWARGSIREIGAEPLFRADAFSDPAMLDRIIPTQRVIKAAGGKKGVYVVQMVGCDDHFAKINVTAGLKFGVLGHPDFIAGRDDIFAQAYLYVPEKPYYMKPADQLQLWVIENEYPRTREIQVLNNGKPLTFKWAGGDETTQTVTPRQAIGQYAIADASTISPGDVLQFDIKGTGGYLLRIGGVPPILCPDEKTARDIAGNLHRTDKAGPLVSFPWQEAMWNSVKDLTKEDLTVGVKPGEWSTISDENLARIALFAWQNSHQPKTVDKLLTRVESILAKQSTFSVYDLMTSLNVSSGEIDDAAMFYLYPFEGNRLYGNEALRNIITLALVHQWLQFRNGEVIYRPHELNVAYMQGFHWEYWECVYLMKESLKPDVLKAFQTGLTHIAERMHYANGLELVITNGRTTVPLNIYYAYLVSEQSYIKDLAKRYYMRMYTALDGPHAGRSKTGYFREHFAPDGGYTTYPLYQLGKLYLVSKDPDVLAGLDGLAKWVVTTAIPRGGSMTGPTSWNARIHAAGIEHIWGMGYRYFADQSPWAAALAHHFDAKHFNTPDPDMQPGKPVPDKPILLLTHLTRNVAKPVKFPAVAKGDLFEDLGGGGEHFVIRRGDYYGIVYAGRRTPFWMDQTVGGTQGYTGGGLAALYQQSAKAPILLGRVLKEYGFPIDRPQDFAVPVVAGQVSDGRWFNTGVSRCEVTTDPKTFTVTTTGEAVSAPVNFERGYTFNKTSIDVHISLRNADMYRDVFQYRKYFRPAWQSIKEAWEIIPVRELADTKVTAFDAAGESLGELDPGKPMHGLHHREMGEAGTPGAELAGVASLRIVNTEGNTATGVMEIRFDQPATVRLTSSLQVLVTRDLQPEQVAELNYQMLPKGM